MASGSSSHLTVHHHSPSFILSFILNNATLRTLLAFFTEVLHIDYQTMAQKVVKK